MAIFLASPTPTLWSEWGRLALLAQQDGGPVGAAHPLPGLADREKRLVCRRRAGADRRGLGAGHLGRLLLLGLGGSETGGEQGDDEDLTHWSLLSRGGGVRWGAR